MILNAPAAGRIYAKDSIVRFSLRLLLALLAIGIPASDIDAQSKLKGNSFTDSLTRTVPGIKADTDKIKALHRLADELYSSNPQKSIEFAQQSLEIATHINNAFLTALSYNHIGTGYLRMADYPAALDAFFKGLKTFETHNIQNRQFGYMLSNIGTVYLNQNNYPKAKEYYGKAIPIYQQFVDKTGLANTYNGLGTVSALEQDYEKSFEYYTKAIALNEEVGNNREIALIFGNIGDNYKDQLQYPKAMSYYDKALNLYQLLDDKDGIATNDCNIGKCIFLIATNPTYDGYRDSLITHNRNANLQKAITYLERGIRLSREVGDVANLIDFLPALSDLYELTGNLQGSLEQFKTFAKLKDSVYSSENSQKIAGLETQRERELKAKIEALNRSQQRIRNGIIIAGFAILLLFIYVVYSNFLAQKKSNKLLAVEKQVSEDLLLNILPSEVADELKKRGIAEPRYFEEVTILFTDFVGFTKVSEKMSPQELVAELDYCFRGFDEIMERYGIEKIKTIGDAYLAVSGLPVRNNDHALNMVMAAIDIKRFMYERRHQLGENTFEIRIGLHSGGVIAGIVGMKKYAYDIWGDTVNTAARMEQNSIAGKINISESTYQLVRHKIECVYRGELSAKNKGLLKMYFVTV